MLVDQIHILRRKFFPRIRWFAISFERKFSLVGGRCWRVVPGRSAHAHDAASPCGSLITNSLMTIPSKVFPSVFLFPGDHIVQSDGSLTVLLNLVVVLDRLYIPHTISQPFFRHISSCRFHSIAQAESFIVFIVSSIQGKGTHHVDGWGTSRVVVVEGCWSDPPSRQKMNFSFFVWPPADWLTASLSEP